METGLASSQSSCAVCMEVLTACVWQGLSGAQGELGEG